MNCPAVYFRRRAKSGSSQRDWIVVTAATFDRVQRQKGHLLVAEVEKTQQGYSRRGYYLIGPV